MQIRTLVAVALPLLAAASAASAAILVDDFRAYPTGTTLDGALPSATLVNGGLPVPGGVRTTTLTQTTIDQNPILYGSFIDFSIYTSAGVGYFDFQSPSRRDGAVSIAYNFSSLNLPLLTGIEVAFNAYDFAVSTPLALSLTITYAGSAPQTSFPVALYSSTTPGTIMVPAFGIVPGPGIVTNVAVNFETPKGGDVALTSLSYETDTSVLPEPSTALIAFPALAALLRRPR